MGNSCSNWNKNAAERVKNVSSGQRVVGWHGIHRGDHGHIKVYFNVHRQRHCIWSLTVPARGWWVGLLSTRDEGQINWCNSSDPKSSYTTRIWSYVGLVCRHCPTCQSLHGVWVHMCQSVRVHHVRVQFGRFQGVRIQCVRVQFVRG